MSGGVLVRWVNEPWIQERTAVATGSTDPALAGHEFSRCEISEPLKPVASSLLCLAELCNTNQEQLIQASGISYVVPFRLKSHI